VEFVSERFDGDIGKVSDTLDLPNSNPQKRELINEFVSEYLPKTISPDASVLQETYQGDAKSVREVSRDAFEAGAENFKEEMGSRVGGGFGRTVQKVDRLQEEIGCEDQNLKSKVDQEKKNLAYESSGKEAFEASYENPLREYGAKKGMLLPTIGVPLIDEIAKPVGQFGAKCVREVLFQLGSEVNKE